MAKASKVTLKLNDSAVKTVIGGASAAAAKRAAQKTAGRAERNVVASGRVRTGRMARGYRVTSERNTSLAPSATVHNVMPYAIYQEKGTRYIRGGRFLERAVAQLTPDDFRA